MYVPCGEVGMASSHESSINGSRERVGSYSPYLLQETLQTHLSQNAEGSKFVDKFYVDNYMNSLLMITKMN